MKASAQITYSDVSTSAITTLIADSPNPIFILGEDRTTIISSNESGLSGRPGLDLTGKSIQQVLFNYNTCEPEVPVYYCDTWYKTDTKYFNFLGSEYLKVTLTSLSDHISEDTLKTTQDLIAILLHRFRSPLTAIQGYSDIISLKADSNGQQKYLDKINRGTEHISGILDEFESLIIDENEEQRDMIKIRSLLNELISAHKESVQKRIHFRAPENASILGSKEKIRKILCLLVENALEHSKDPESPIMISVRNSHTFEISNRGKAISREKAEEIFKPFITSRSDKTGIGLTLAQLLAKKLGATIHLKSGEENNITFVLNLPPKYMTVHSS